LKKQDINCQRLKNIFSFSRGGAKALRLKVEIKSFAPLRLRERKTALGGQKVCR
jgi:hypothetical protein